MRLLLFMMFSLFLPWGEQRKGAARYGAGKCGSLESLADCRDILLRYGVADRIPLACPLRDKFRISSAYGGRIHPITGKRGFHSGIDMAVELAAPVCATASGTVSFAGRKGGYGRCVVIRHSYGLRPCMHIWRHIIPRRDKKS